MILGLIINFTFI